MQRTTKILRIFKVSVTTTVISLGCQVLSGPVSAAHPNHSIQSESEEDPEIESGRKVFQRQWESRAIEQPTQGNLSDEEFAVSLRAQPGDGLGPMYNATSCEACHVGGGAAGVHHNVTLLTLDPRSPFLKSSSNASFPGQLSSGFRFAGQRLVNTELAGPLSMEEQNAKDAVQKIEAALEQLYPALIAADGQLTMDTVVHDHSSRPFYDEIRQGIAGHVPGGIEPTWFDAQHRTSAAIGNRPVVAGRIDEIDFYLSQRNSPPLYGLGDVDRITDLKLQGIARSQFRQTKGRVTGRIGAGKFGWRGQTQSLSQFVSGACAGELGLQTDLVSQPPDVADEGYQSFGRDMMPRELSSLLAYVQSIPPPPVPRMTPETRKGEKVFEKVGCSVCHIKNVLPASGVYSDFLLHDMGQWLQAPSPAALGNGTRGIVAPTMTLPQFSPSLANRLDPANRLSPSTSVFLRSRPASQPVPVSSYYGFSSLARSPAPYPFERPVSPKFPIGSLPENVANGDSFWWDVLQREWRTPPLWGVADSAPYLHDGRAETLDAAIRWHGGEAALSATMYRSLSEQDQELLLTFLESQKGPAGPSSASGEALLTNVMDPRVKLAEDVLVFD